MPFLPPSYIAQQIDSVDEPMHAVIHHCAREIARAYQTDCLPWIKKHHDSEAENPGFEKSEETILSLMRKGLIGVEYEDRTLKFYAYDETQRDLVSLPITIKLETGDEQG